MKHLLFGLLGVAIALAIGFWILSRDAGQPTPIATPIAQSPSATPTGNITVTSPRSGEQVQKSFEVKGQARTFEQNVQWRLTDAEGKVLASGFTTATAADVGLFGPYSFKAQIPNGTPDQLLVVQVFESSAEDGSEINKVSVPVVFIP
jgi:hypothetical protein